MQILKDNIKKAIIQSALKHFYESGFEGSSMREIARDAGIAVGNLYRYFKNKEELFVYIIKPVYDGIFVMLRDHEDEDIIVTPENFYQLIDDQSALISEIIFTYRKELVILFEGSRGTEFENAKNTVIDSWTGHVEAHLEVYFRNSDYRYYSYLSLPVTVGFFEGLFAIIKNNEKPEIIKECIKGYLRILFSGFKDFI